MKQKPIIRETRIVAQSRLFLVEEVDLTFSNGQERIYERVRGTRGYGTVMIVPVMEDLDTVLLVKEYGVGVERYEIGLPKGVIEMNEDFFVAADRELKEEIGYGAKRFTLLKRMTNSPGYMRSSVQTILAQDLYPARLEGDEPEPIEVVPWRLSQLSALLENEDFTEARSIAGLFLTLDFLKAQQEK